jgi:hypothetical protein
MAAMALTAVFAAPTIHAQINAPAGINLNLTGEIIQSPVIHEPSANGVDWLYPGANLANRLVPVGQFTGYEDDGTAIPALDLIPLRTTSISLINPSTGVATPLDGKNIYNSNGTLTDHRTITMAGKTLSFDWGTGLGGFHFGNPGYPTQLFLTPGGNRYDIRGTDAGLALLTSPTPNTVPSTTNGINILNNGNVGVGTDAPRATFDVAGTGNVRSSLFFDYTPTQMGTITQVGGTMYYDAQIAAYNGGAVAHVFRSLNTGGSLLYVTHAGNVYAQGSFTPSDRRLKSDVKPLSYGLDTIARLEPREYDQVQTIDMKDGKPVVSEKESAKKHSLGFIAQDLYKIVPEAVSKPADEQNEIWAVDYSKLIPVLTKSIQELNTKVSALEAENTELKKLAGEMKELKALVAALEGKSNGTVTVSLAK